MSGLNAGHVGIAGEVRCVIKRGDGSVKEDTGFQKNLILDQGLDFFGGENSSDIFTGCAIGSGNSNPITTQKQLDSFLAIQGGAESSSKYDYVPSDDNLYKTNKVYKYIFTGLNNVNVSEVGLVSQGFTSSDYYLCTRALLKDSTGAPTTITILFGETLEVYYKLWRVISTLDATYLVNMLDGKGGSTPYNIVVRPAYVGNSINRLGVPATSGSGAWWGSTSDLADITSGNFSNDMTSIAPFYAYVPGSYKLKREVNVATAKGNINIRTITAIEPSSFYFFQMRFGSASGDNPIPKTNLQTLSIPIEYSWGRYEGAL